MKLGYVFNNKKCLRTRLDDQSIIDSFILLNEIAISCTMGFLVFHRSLHPELLFGGNADCCVDCVLNDVDALVVYFPSF